MAMYVRKGPFESRKDLDQGDLFTCLPRPAPVTKSALVNRNGGAVNPATAAEVRAFGKNLRIQVPAEKLDYALILTNSCDIAQGHPIHIAPVELFKFSSRATEAVGQWMEISNAATGGASPRTFYLPGDEELKLPRLSANLAETFTVAFDYLERCAKDAGTARIAGLSTDGVRHLQWKLAYMYSRNPRGDLDWPSREDLLLKLENLRVRAKTFTQLQSEVEELEKLLELEPGGAS